MVRAALSRAGYEVCALGDGKPALAKLEAAARGETRAPDIVVTDLNLPCIDGLDVIAHAIAAFPTLPVVLMTAFGSGYLKGRARAIGAKRILDKPVSMAQLVQTIEDLV